MDPLQALHWVQTNIPPWVYITLVVHFTILGTVAYLILLERKTASWVQDRIGPNRVGFDFGLPILAKLKGMFGLGQPLADGLKFIVKEDYRPKHVDKILFTIAPGIMIIVIIISVATLPWGGVVQSTRRVVVKSAPTPAGLVVGTDDLAQAARAGVPWWATVQNIDEKQMPLEGVVNKEGEVVRAPSGTLPQYHVVADVSYRWSFQIANLNIGVLYILAILSLAVYGVVIGGWASNNKYSFLGALRATANMISYEIPLGLSVLCIVLMFGTLDLGEIISRQAGYWGFIPAWNIFCQPLAFLMFLICIHAEANRAPFDLAEAEQELVGGYHTEYSAMRFALFFLSEYAGMITTSAVCVALFFGGWSFPGVDTVVTFALNHAPFLPHDAFVDPTNPAVTSSILLCLVRSGIFFGKTLVIVFIFMWTRWSLPRFRFDQLMMLAWRALIPMSLTLLLMTATIIYYTRDQEWNGGQMDGHTALIMLLANIVTLVLMLLVSTILPAPPPTNRRVRITNSRFNRMPLPGKGRGIPALNRAALAQVAVAAVPDVTGRTGT